MCWGGEALLSEWIGNEDEKESGERGPPLDSDVSDGEGVLGGVSMEGIGWSLKQADS